jgi:uncharacterized protein (TIGR03546 family)
MLWLIKQFLYLRKAVTTGDSPRLLAFSFALGMVLGLMPKGNLLAVLLSTVLFASRSNLAVAMVSALLFSLAGPLADPVTDRLGAALLRWSVLRPAWMWLDSKPLVPWTAFNNTVVLGSLTLGLLLFYPVYRVVWSLVVWRRARGSADKQDAGQEAPTDRPQDPSEVPQPSPASS